MLFFKIISIVKHTNAIIPDKFIFFNKSQSCVKNAYIFPESNFDFSKLDKKNVQIQLSEKTLGEKYMQICTLTIMHWQPKNRKLFCDCKLFSKLEIFRNIHLGTFCVSILY